MEGGEQVAKPIEREHTDLGLTFFAYTTTSIHHSNRNEDAIVSSPETGIAMVFDGVGGEAGGDKASQLAKTFIKERLSGIQEEGSTINDIEEVINQALVETSSRISQEIPGAGTTATIVRFLEIDGSKKAIVGHVGDSRGYLLRKGKLTQITEDDSMISVRSVQQEEVRRISDKVDQISTSEELERATDKERLAFRERNVITQSLGADMTPIPHIYRIDLEVGDKVILTSDGVHDNLTKSEIEEVLRNGPTDLATALVEKAKARSAERGHVRAKPDDISAIVVEIRSSNEGIKAETIEDSQDFEDLYRVLERMNGIQGSNRFYTAEELKEILGRVKEGELSLSFVTRSGGLREKVEELLKKKTSDTA